MVKTESTQVLQKGNAAPDFSLKGTDDTVYSLGSFSSSKLLLVVFICNHCPYVKARVHDLVALQSKFSRPDLQVIAINSNDPNYQDEGFENMKRFVKEYRLNFPYLFDGTQTTARSYGAVCTPDPFLFNSERKLVFHGKINDAIEPDMTPKVQTMEENVKKLVRGQDLEKDFDPSVGCSIKWKS
ncbi:MAG TPA: thioredoxin family protein [Nitrososphaeraceae archaeon]|nr:thioredoxin family protein [Nitrososphaeraceae archaeon]